MNASRRTDSIIDLARSLIKTPTQGGLDPNGPALELLRSWLIDNGVDCTLLRSADTSLVGALCEVRGRREGPTYSLTACVDTAPFGDPESWELPPTSAHIRGGWLYGRGSADSKTAVAIFSHIAAALQAEAGSMRGIASFFFDGDEHTGEFGGIKAYVRECPDLNGVFIGYPGNEAVCNGCRGFYRAQITTYGTAAHSGTFKESGGNAIEKATLLVGRLRELRLAREVDSDFGVGPKLSVTEISGGAGYSILPDKCDIRVDVRLTPRFDAARVAGMIAHVVAGVDADYPTRRGTKIVEEESWPAYKLPEDSPVLAALLQSARKYFGKTIGSRVCGPSNVGNFLSSLNIEATCGFGVSYRNVHGPNECIDISTVEPVYKVYYDAIKTLLSSNA